MGDIALPRLIATVSRDLLLITYTSRGKERGWGVTALRHFHFIMLANGNERRTRYYVHLSYY